MAELAEVASSGARSVRTTPTVPASAGLKNGHAELILKRPSDAANPALPACLSTPSQFSACSLHNPSVHGYMVVAPISNFVTQLCNINVILKHDFVVYRNPSVPG